MAIEQGSEKFTKWTHLENGAVLSRRLHRMEIQGRDGRLYILQGDQLPDYFLTSCGTGHKGVHCAQILLNPKPPRPNWITEEPAFWPKARDVVHMVLGGFGMLLLQFFIELVAAN